MLNFANGAKFGIEIQDAVAFPCWVHYSDSGVHSFVSSSSD